MRRLALVLTAMALVATSVHAQLVPVRGAPGGVSAGCPADWEHRESFDGGFACRDTDSGAFCNGATLPPRGVDQAEEVAALRADAVARGRVILRDGRDGGLDWFVHDDSAGHRMMLLVRRDPGRVLVVTCGSAPAAFDPQTATFIAIASSAH